MRHMKKNVKTVLKDGAVGVGIGCAVIVPGISGGTIALITGAFKKIVDAVDKLFTKYFIKNLLILLPFGIGAVIAIAGLYFPIKLSFEHCMLAIVCLFAGFMAGSVPSVAEKAKGNKLTPANIIGLIAGFALVVAFGLVSIKFNLNSQVETMFVENKFYLYLLIFAVGVISSTGLIIPGFSGSMLLMILGFYDKILLLAEGLFKDPLISIARLGTFALGVLIGFVLFSKLMKYMFEKHPTTTNCVVLGFLIGSIIAIYTNSQMFEYLGYYEQDSKLNVLDFILSPLFMIIGFAISFAIYIYAKKHPEVNEHA